jgi:hypothetical protein
MRMYRCICVCALLALSSLASAQAGPDSVCEVNVTNPKPGAAKAWEAARKQHNKFHMTEKDKNSINVWNITTGPATGSYLTTVCGLAWKDMGGSDGFEQRDIADRQNTLALQTGGNQAGYYVYLPDMSLSGPPAESATPKMITIVHYFVKPGSVAQFTDAVRRINGAIKKSQYPAKPSRWYVLANGGEGPHYVLVTNRDSWVDMQGPQQSMADMLKQAGEEKALQDARDAIHHIVSEMAVYRADLSYVPQK